MAKIEKHQQPLDKLEVFDYLFPRKLTSDDRNALQALKEYGFIKSTSTYEYHR